MQPDPEFLGLGSRQVEFRRAQPGKFGDNAASSLKYTLSVDITQLHSSLRCPLTRIGHHKSALRLPCRCWILSDLDHNSSCKSALVHHEIRHYQDNYPNKYRYQPLERILPDKKPMQEQDAHSYQVDHTCYQWMAQKVQNEPWHVFSFPATGAQQEHWKCSCHHSYSDDSHKTQHLGK